MATYGNGEMIGMVVITEILRLIPKVLLMVLIVLSVAVVLTAIPRIVGCQIAIKAFPITEILN